MIDVTACTVLGCGMPVHSRRPAKGFCTTHLTRWYRHGDVLVLKNRPKGTACLATGCALPPHTKNLCRGHYSRHIRGCDINAGPLLRASPVGTRTRNLEGYVLVKVSMRPPTWMLEHRMVLETQLGRPLWPDEHVHHRNGLRGDNRPENLELWVVSQPAGQRVQDLLRWAQHIVERYGQEI